MKGGCQIEHHSPALQEKATLKNPSLIRVK